MAEDFERTDRGFAFYGEVVDDRNTKLRLQESSAVGRPHVHLYIDGDPRFYHNPELARPHLSVEGAEELIKLLQAFVRHAREPENWRNQPDYIRNWG